MKIFVKQLVLKKVPTQGDRKDELEDEDRLRISVNDVKWFLSDLEDRNLSLIKNIQSDEVKLEAI
jgi:hypothetical protein